MFFFVAEEDESALKRSELVNWYLKEIESEIDSEEELINKKRIIEKVIHRLTHYVGAEVRLFWYQGGRKFMPCICRFTSEIFFDLCLF